MDFTVTITDPDQLAGITWAREQRNAAIPVPGEGEPPAEGLLVTDEAYVQLVMDQPAASYAQQKIDAEWRAAYDAAATSRLAGRAR